MGDGPGGSPRPVVVLHPPAAQEPQPPVANATGEGSVAWASRGLPVLLGQLSQCAGQRHEDPKYRPHMPEATRARDAYLSRQNRIATRRPLPPPSAQQQHFQQQALGSEGERKLQVGHGPVKASEWEEQLARAARDAYLSRRACVAGRRPLTKP